MPSSENDRDDATEGKNGDTVSNVAPMSTLASEKYCCMGVFANTGLVAVVVIKREYTLSRFSIYHIAAMRIQYMWRSFHRK